MLSVSLNVKQVNTHVGIPVVPQVGPLPDRGHASGTAETRDATVQPMRNRFAAHFTDQTLLTPVLWGTR